MVRLVSVVALSAGAVFMMFMLRLITGRRDRRSFVDRLRANGV